MKTNLKLTIILMFLLCGISYGQAITEPYRYPVRPGMEQWKEVKPKDRINTLTIPADVLKNMTTLALAKTCLDFPLFHEVMAADNLQQGFDQLTKLFNGFQELLTRKDASAALIQLYTRMDPNDVKKETTLARQGDVPFNFTYIELLLAQDKIITSLSKEQREVLRKAAISRFESKNTLAANYGDFGLNTTARILVKLLKADGKQGLLQKSATQQEIDTYTSISMFSNKRLLTSIYTASKSY